MSSIIFIGALLAIIVLCMESEWFHKHMGEFEEEEQNAGTNNYVSNSR